MENRINQSVIPQRTLYSGEKIPCMGLGTFGSDKYGAEAGSEAVYGAVKYGYRMIDCAAVYQNEEKIGQVLRRLFRKMLLKEKSCLLPPRYGTICTGKEKYWNPVKKACRIWDFHILICILSTGLFRIIMRRDVTAIPEIPIPDPSR